MNGISLSSEQRHGRLKFWLFPSLGVAPRLILLVLVASAGASLAFRLSPWIGVPVFLFGLLLGVGRGASNKRTGADTSDDRWVIGAGKDLRQIRRKLEQAKGLPANFLSAQSGWGCLVLVLLAIGVAVLDAVLLPGSFLAGHFGTIVFMQAAVLLFVFLTTTAGGWSPPDIGRKIDLFEAVRDHVLERWNNSQPVVMPMLKIDDGGQEGLPTPEDLKLFIRFDGAPEGFIGIQAQMTFNQNQPYLYCVVLAKDTFSPLESYSPKTRDEITYETGEDGDVRFLVVRKTTSRNSYSTDQEDAMRVVDVAMSVAADLVAQ